MGVTPPPLTSEQRSQAAQTALAARRRRAEIKAGFHDGTLSLSNVLDLTSVDPAVDRLRVVELLEAFPRVGPVRASAIMSDLGIAPSRRLRGLGQHQKQALLDYFEGM